MQPQNSKVINVTYYGDAGHGWYRVKKKDLAYLGLLDKISMYSYERGASVYLEEDRDASLFFDKVRDTPKMLWDTKQAKRVSRSPIRSYTRYVWTEHIKGAK